MNEGSRGMNFRIFQHRKETKRAVTRLQTFRSNMVSRSRTQKKKQGTGKPGQQGNKATRATRTTWPTGHHGQQSNMGNRRTGQ